MTGIGIIKLLHERTTDFIVAFITTRSHFAGVSIDQSNPKYTLTGLRAPSTIRLDKVATLKKTLIVGEIGEVGVKLRQLINEGLHDIFTI